MSRVYFHSEDGTAELLGCERAYAGCLVNDLALGLLSLRSVQTRERLSSLVDPRHYAHRLADTDERWAMSYATSFAVASGGLVTWKGRKVDPFDLALNTAMLVGSDQVRFLARLHGQCEIHGYVQGSNRAWLAGLIREGRASELYRPDMGWEKVADLLASSDSGPVVMSYSVTDGFPSYRHAVESDRVFGVDEDLCEEYYNTLGSAARWAMGRRWLRQQPISLEIHPGRGYTGFGRYRFGHGLTVLDLLAPDYADRLDRALGLVET